MGVSPKKNYSEEIMAGEKRPTVATVFAILHFVFGGFGVIGGLIGLAGSFALAAILGPKFAFVIIFAIIGLLFAALLIFAGVTLIANKKNAVQVNFLYAILSVAYAVINTIVQTAIIGSPIGWFGLILGLVYPALIFFLIVRNEEVKKFYA